MFQKYLTQFIWPKEAASLASGERAHGEGLPGGLRSWRTSVCSMACRKSLSSTTVQPFSASSFSKHRLGLPSGSRTLREHCSKSRQLPTTDLSQVSTFTSVQSAYCMFGPIVGVAGNKQQVVEWWKWFIGQTTTVPFDTVSWCCSPCIAEVGKLFL